VPSLLDAVRAGRAMNQTSRPRPPDAREQAALAEQAAAQAAAEREAEQARRSEARERKRAEARRPRAVELWVQHLDVLGPKREKLDSLAFQHRDIIATIPVDTPPELLQSSAFRPPQGPPVRFTHEPPKPAARTAEAVLERLAERHVSVALAPDKVHIIVSAPAGHIGVAVAAVLKDYAPLLAMHLGGALVYCAFDGKHAATGLLLGGAGYCPEHDPTA
jgi:hypothetical protein